MVLAADPALRTPRGLALRDLLYLFECDEAVRLFEAAVADPLKAMLEVEVPDLDALTQHIDEASQGVLAPPDTESPSPSEESPDGG